MSWFTEIFILCCLLIVFLVFANDQKPPVNHDNHGNDKITNDVKVEKPKVLVEVTDAIEDEEEETLPYKPSIAPATPQLLLSSSRFLHVEPEVHKEVPKGENIELLGENNKEIPTLLKGEFSTQSTHSLHNISKEKTSSIPITLKSAMSSSSQKTLFTSILASTSLNIPASVPTKKPYNSNPATETYSATADQNIGQLDVKKDRSVIQTDASKEILSFDGGHQATPGLNTTTITPNVEETDTSSLNIPSKESDIDQVGTLSNNDESVGNLSEENVLKTSTPELPETEIGGLGVPSEKNIVNLGDESGLSDKEENKPPSSSALNHLEKTENVEHKIDDQKVVPPPPTNISPPPQETEKVDVDEDGDSVDSKKKMLSFAEWKKSKEEEDTNNQSKLVVPKKNVIQKKKKTSKIKKNFASIDCGGKVIAANEEASNILSVLKEDKDIYMLNPCNVKAWFVVELCDRIQVDSIDLANFEMFSSTPESFNVFVTSRYPSGSWEKVDTFHAKPEKKVQTYDFKEEFYAKYIKIEIKKYFGSEHYCPLSLLRVYGITEVEQFEESDEEQNEEISAQHEHEVEHHADEKKVTEETNSGNIFEAARNVVAGLVNGMAIKLTGKTDPETNETNSLAETSAVVTVTAINEHAPAEDESMRYYNDSIVVGENSVNWEMWYYYRYPRQTCAMTDPRYFIKEIKATVFFPDNNVSTPYQLSSSMIGDNLVAKIVATQRSSVPSAATAVVDENQNVSLLKDMITPSFVITETGNPQEMKAPLISTRIEASNSEAHPAEASVVEIKNNSNESVIGNDLNASFSKPPAAVKPLDEETADVLHFKVNETVNGAVVAEKLEVNISQPIESMEKSIKPAVPDGLDSHKPGDIDNTTILSSGSVGSQDVDPKTSPPSEDISKSEVPTPIEENASNENHDKSTNSMEEDNTGLNNKEKLVPKDSATLPNEDTKTTTPDEKNDELKVKSSDVKKKVVVDDNNNVEKDTLIITPNMKPSGSKESIIAKLNAKVKGLEANLTMSMMYLDEMSERYQTAVEKVDERHKKKYCALNTSFLVQQEVIKNQSILIESLTKSILNIEFQLQNLTHTTQDQHQKMIEIHATWVFLEIVFILVFLLLCRSKPKTVPAKCDDDEKYPARRASEPAMAAKEPKLIGLRKQISDPTGACLETNNQALQNGLVAKKKKRKRSSKIIPELTINSANHENDVSNVVEKVGPIFGLGWMNGLTGAFKGKSQKQNISRQANALIDEVTERSYDNAVLRKVKSSELPVIHEDNDNNGAKGRVKDRIDLDFYRKSN